MHNAFSASTNIWVLLFWWGVYSCGNSTIFVSGGSNRRFQSRSNVNWKRDILCLRFRHGLGQIPLPSYFWSDCAWSLWGGPFVGTSITLPKGKNLVTEGCVMGQASVRPHITDVFVFFRVVKQKVLDFILPGGTKKWIILCDLLEDFLEFFVMHKT